MAPRVKPEVLCFRLFCGNRSVTAKSRGKPSKVFLVEELGEVAVGLVLGHGEGVQDGALRLERLGGAVSLHGLRGGGGARGSGGTRGVEARGTTSAPANAPNLDGETKEGAENVATARYRTTSDGCREGVIDGSPTVRQDRAARRWAEAT